MNPHYKYWDKCQRCPKNMCETRYSNMQLTNSYSLAGYVDWRIEAPCNYTTLYNCHDKNMTLHLVLSRYKLGYRSGIKFLSIQEVFDYLLANAKDLEEAVTITKIRNKLKV